MLSTLQQHQQSSVVLANALEVISAVVKNIAGNDVSNSLNGSKITTDIIQSIALQRLKG